MFPGFCAELHNKLWTSRRLKSHSSKTGVIWENQNVFFITSETKLSVPRTNLKLKMMTNHLFLFFGAENFKRSFLRAWNSMFRQHRWLYWNEKSFGCSTINANKPNEEEEEGMKRYFSLKKIGDGPILPQIIDKLLTFWRKLRKLFALKSFQWNDL